MDVTDPLAGIWKFNDIPTLTGWDLDTGGAVFRGNIYFIVEHGNGSTKFMGLEVTDSYQYTQGLAIGYWEKPNIGYHVYNSSKGGWNVSDNKSSYDALYNQTIKIMSTDWSNEATKNCVTAWLNANATRIS